MYRGKFAFSNRVCDSWNGLPEDTVTASSINIFKNKLDRHLQVTWGLKRIHLNKKFQPCLATVGNSAIMTPGKPYKAA